MNAKSTLWNISGVDLIEDNDSNSKENLRDFLIQYEKQITNFEPEKISYDNITSKDIVIARTFTYGRTDNTLGSFQIWSEKPPCENKQSYGLILHFSGNISKKPEILGKLAKFKNEFESKSQPWHNCFAKVQFLDAKIPKARDIYKPSEQNTNLDWVNGPNEQFRKLLYSALKGREYKYLFLMEPDSIPRKAFWLDAFLDEIITKRPFAILGSIYRGDKWDSFYSEISTALKEHINGNAIYEIFNPFMIALLNQLTEEVNSELRSVPFDYRMGQILLNKSSLRTLRRYIYKKSDIIANYAASRMLEQYYSNEFIAHGAKNKEIWPRNIPISLVVSDWGISEYLEVILKSITNNEHPFQEVIIFGPKSSHRNQSNISDIKFIKRGDFNPGEDWCRANITNKWFMYTNTYHKLRNHIHLFIEPLNSGEKIKPNLVFLQQKSEHCIEYPDCVNSVIKAKIWNLKYDKHIESEQLIFNTEARDSFCEAWFKYNTNDTNYPTTDDYVSWTSANREIYSYIDVEKYGKRANFIRQDLPTFETNLLPSNTTECSHLGTEEECQESGTCFWRDGFDTCVVNETDPQFKPIIDILPKFKPL